MNSNAVQLVLVMRMMACIVVLQLTVRVLPRLL